MAGPYPQYSDPSPTGPPSQSNYSGPEQAVPYPSAATSVYPGNLPPPVPYPSPRRWRLLTVVLLVIAVVAGATTAIVFAVNSDSSTTGGRVTDSRAKSAIQDYLDAMVKGDTDTVAKNSACGLWDALKDRKQDQQVARQMSESFRKTYSKANVTSIDKIAFLSPYQAQVLFTMRVTPVTRGSRERDEQATANLLSQDDKVYVCQYVPRVGSQF
jgi:hypothetical protein